MIVTYHLIATYPGMITGGPPHLPLFGFTPDEACHAIAANAVSFTSPFHPCRIYNLITAVSFVAPSVGSPSRALPSILSFGVDFPHFRFDKSDSALARRT